MALPGPNFDGHDHVGAAAGKGAAGALVARPVDSALPQVIVGDTLEALAALARAARARSGRAHGRDHRQGRLADAALHIYHRNAKLVLVHQPFVFPPYANPVES